jgi:hypothetical protein
MKNKNVKKFGFNLFLISITFFHVIKFESEVYSAVNYHFYHDLPTVELIVHSKPEYNLQSVKDLSTESSLSFGKNTSNFFHSDTRKYLFKLSRFVMIPQISNEQIFCSPTHKIITFLQNTSNWFSSADEDPAIINYC